MSTDPDRLFADHYIKIAKWARKRFKIPGMDRDDIEQEAIVAMLKAAKKYRPDMERPVCPETWLSWAARAHLRSLYKKAIRREAINGKDEEGGGGTGGLDRYFDPAAKECPFDEHLVREIIETAPSLLTEGQYEAIKLRFLDGLTRAESAERLGISEASVQDRVEGGLARLREYFGEGI